jgi:RNA ligase
LKDDLLKTIKEISKEHPASHIPFDELSQNLELEIKNKNINVDYHPLYPHLALYKYSNHCVQDRLWSLYSLISRGLVLDHKNKKVAAIPFPKFFALGEIFDNYLLFSTEKYTITSKKDGSLIIAFNNEGNWIFTTCGSFVSSQAKWAEQWAKEHLPLDKMDKNNTYLFEAIYPENKIVVHYDTSELVLLSIFDSYGLEYPYELLEKEREFLGVNLVEAISFNSIQEVMDLAKTLDKNEEGFVIRFDNGVRLKVKGDEYLRIFNLISNLTPLSVWESYLCDQDMEKMAQELPDDLRPDFWDIFNILKNKLYKLVDEIETMYQNTKNLSDAELGIMLQEHPEAFTGSDFPNAEKFLFTRRKGFFYKDLNKPNSRLRRQLFNMFKPKSNILEGYSPTWSIRAVKNDN